MSTAVAGLKAIFRPGFNYAKAGVMLMDLQADTVSHVELDLEGDETPDHTRLKSTLDALNQRLEKETVLIETAGLASEQRAWVMKQKKRTLAYSTCWEDLAVVRA